MLEMMKLTSVNPKVHVVRHPLVEPFRAMRAGVLFPISVNFQVTAEVAPVVEDFPAFRAFRRELFGTFMNRSKK